MSQSLTVSRARGRVALLSSIAFSLSLVVALPLSAEQNCQTGLSPSVLFQEGCISEARAGFQQQLSDARGSGNPRSIWTALIGLAWFEDEIGNHREALKHSNEALMLSEQLNDSAAKARTLTWIAWAHSGLGRYQAALSFYEEALELITAGDVISNVHIWGLSMQEKGALLFKMGEVDRGRKVLREVFTFAKEQRIDIGITESAVHLVDIALHEGRVGEAKKIAAEGLVAALRCKCGPAKIAKAQVSVLKAATAEALEQRALRTTVLAELKRMRASIEASGDIRSIAELNLLHARLLPADAFSQRYELVSSAYQRLMENENELSGLAAADMGSTLLDERDLPNAEFYLSQGIELSQELFRVVDSSRVMAELAALSGIKGDIRARLEQLEAAAVAAVATSSPKDAYAAEIQLAEEYVLQGYHSLAHRWAEKALKSSEQLIEAETDAKRSARLEQHRLKALELMTESALKVAPPGEQHLLL